MEPEEWAEQVGRHVAEARGAESQASIARRAGLGATVWRQIETGRRTIAKGVVVAPTPERETRLAVARVLRWPPPAIDWLLEGDDPNWWDGKPIDGGIRWTRSVPGDPDAPMVVTEIREFRDFLVRPGEKGPVVEGVAAQPDRMALERAKEAHEEVIRLKVHVEALADRLDGHDRQLGALLEVPEKLDQVLAALTSQGGVGEPEPKAVLGKPSSSGFSLAAQGERDSETEPDTVADIDRARKKSSPRRKS